MIPWIIGLAVATGIITAFMSRASASEKSPSKEKPVEKTSEKVTDYSEQTKTGKRKEEFLPDGKRVKTTPEKIRSEWESVNTDIPSSYAVATGQHESSDTLNEKDTEGSGFISKGVFQISDEEEKDAGFQKDDAYDLTKATGILSNLSNKRWKAILAAGKKAKAAGKPFVEKDAPAYLVIAHNQGESKALESIGKYGMDWGAYKKRNKGGYFDKLASYGDDAIPSSSVSGLYMAGIE